MKRFLLNFNWLLFVATLGLVALGVVFVGSAGSSRAIVALQNAWKAHAVTAGIGLALMFAIAAVDYRKILAHLATPAYVLALVLLAAVLVFGAKIYGGRRWLWFFQPSEAAKLALILFAARIFALLKGRFAGFRGFLIALALFVPPGLLILAEPDLGTALVLVPTALAMMLGARIWSKGVWALVAAGLLAAGIVLGIVRTAEQKTDPAEQARLYAYLPLKPHQVARLRTFVNPEADPYGSGWNLRQAKISIGSGSLAGKGIGRGDQKFLGYLPPSVSMNDFIFAVLAEEAGFRGSALVLFLFALLYGAGTCTALRCGDDAGRLLVVGVMTLLFSHMYVNIAMSVGLMPITGLPLPFISAGKTFLLVALASLGLVESVAVHGRRDLHSHNDTIS